MKIKGFDDGFLTKKIKHTKPYKNNKKEKKSNYLDTMLKLTAVVINDEIDFENEEFGGTLLMLLAFETEAKDFNVDEILGRVDTKHKYFSEVKNNFDKGLDISDNIFDAIDLFLKYDIIDPAAANLLTVLFNSQHLEYFEHYIDYCYEMEIDTAFIHILTILFTSQKLTIPYLFNLTRALMNEDIYEFDPSFLEYLIEVGDAPNDRIPVTYSISKDVIFNEIELFIKNGFGGKKAEAFVRKILDEYFEGNMVDLDTLYLIVEDVLETNTKITDVEKSFIFMFLDDVVTSIENKLMRGRK